VLPRGLAGLTGLVCVCRAGGRVYVFEASDLYECKKRGYEMARLAWDTVCEPEAREELWGWAA
jgi:hypothetical protein